MTEMCPKCHKETLRVINVMGSTERISYHCPNCCYREKRDYQGNIVEQSKTIDAELLQGRKRVLDTLMKISRYIPSPLSPPNDIEALQYIHTMNCYNFHKEMNNLIKGLREREG